MEGPGKHIFRVQLGDKNEYSDESADNENKKWGVGVGVIKAKSSFVYDPEEPCSPCMPLNNWIICQDGLITYGDPEDHYFSQNEISYEIE